MKSKMRILCALVAVAAVSAGAVRAQDHAPSAPDSTARPAPKIDDLFADPVIAKGKGVEIRQGRMDEAIANLRARAIAQGEQINPAQMPLLEKQVFDNLLMSQLLTARATEAEKAKGKEDGDKQFELYKKRAPSEEALVKQLKALGLTLEKFHERLIEEAIPQAVLRSKVTVTDDEAKKYYEDHPGDFEEPEMVRASHILILTTDSRTGAPLSDEQLKAKRKQIEDLLKRARAGEDFEKMATQYSEDPGSREKGGVYTFARGQMLAPFEAAAFSLKTNQISDVVTTSYGYHIIKLLEKIPAQKYELAKVNSNIKEFIAREKVEKMAPDLYTSMKKEAGVEILDPKLKALLDIEPDTGFQSPGKAPPK
jgi:peptidyl-prolyl cis-trans isomerase C